MTEDFSLIENIISSCLYLYPILTFILFIYFYVVDISLKTYNALNRFLVLCLYCYFPYISTKDKLPFLHLHSDSTL